MSKKNNIDINELIETLGNVLKSIPKNKKTSDTLMVTSLAGLASVGIYKLVDYLNKKD